MIGIRPAEPSDTGAIREVILAAFPAPDEANLVEALRTAGDVVLELVAEDDDRIVGHILYSELPIDGKGRTVRAASLAPLAVQPDHQRQGIGGALIHMSLAMLAHTGVEAVVVVGEPEYYTRFGFSGALAANLQTPFTGPYLMALELEQGSIDGFQGKPRYSAAFGL